MTNFRAFLAAGVILGAIILIGMHMPAGTLTVVFVLFLYGLPTLIALARHHHQATAIFLLNLFFGWTVLGWIGALIWSATAVWSSNVRLGN